MEFLSLKYATCSGDSCTSRFTHSRRKENDKRAIIWDDSTTHAFNQCKQALVDAVQLAYPAPDASLSLRCDASDNAIGAALDQTISGVTQPLGFYTSKLSKTERNYSTYDRELLSIFKAIKFFKHLVEGRYLIIYTDHRPLSFALSQRSDKASPRQQRQLQYISQFTTNIIHVPGKDHIVADAMSRIDTINLPTLFSPEGIAAEQIDDELKQLLKSHTTSLQFRKQKIEGSNTELYCDVSTNVIRPYIPEKLRFSIFKNAHDLSHPNARATQNLSTNDMCGRI